MICALKKQLFAVFKDRQSKTEQNLAKLKKNRHYHTVTEDTHTSQLERETLGSGLTATNLVSFEKERVPNSKRSLQKTKLRTVKNPVLGTSTSKTNIQTSVKLCIHTSTGKLSTNTVKNQLKDTSDKSTLKNEEKKKLTIPLTSRILAYKYSGKIFLKIWHICRSHQALQGTSKPTQCTWQMDKLQRALA